MGGDVRAVMCMALCEQVGVITNTHHQHHTLLPAPLFIYPTPTPRVDLGSAPPIVSNVRIFEDEHELTPDVMMDMELTWYTENMLAEVLVQLVGTHMKYLPKTVAKALSGLMTFRVCVWGGCRGEGGR